MVPEQIKIRGALALMRQYYDRRGYTSDFIEEVVADTRRILLNRGERELDTVISRDTLAEVLLEDTRHFEGRHLLASVREQREFARQCAPAVFDRVYAGMVRVDGFDAYFEETRFERYAVRLIRRITSRRR